MSGLGPELLSIYLSIAEWMKCYVTSPHPHLGRSGDICPFTTQALRIDTIRIGVCDADSRDLVSMHSCMRYCLRQFALMPAPRSMQHFRSIIVGFPNLEGAVGLECLKNVQNRLKFSTLLRGVMIGRFHADSADPGIWNADFRPSQSPIPLLVIREVVKEDAPFAIRHPLLIPTYVWKFPLEAPGRLLVNLTKLRRQPAALRFP